MTETTPENNTKDLKFYSSGAIIGATFLGGPLAAGYLIGENYKAIDQPIAGRNSLIIGIVSTLLLFVGLFMLPENIIDRIPSALFPLLYTPVIWWIVEQKQGDFLKAHKENNNSFFSGWRAAGIGILSSLILLIGIFGYAFLSTDNTLFNQYDTEIERFTKNENETLIFYDYLDAESNYSLILELDENSIPKWKENVEIMNELSQLEDLPYELIIQNEVLLKYAELRLQAFELFRKSFEEDTEQYAQELEEIHMQISEELEKLN